MGFAQVDRVRMLAKIEDYVSAFESVLSGVQHCRLLVLKAILLALQLGDIDINAACLSNRSRRNFANGPRADILKPIGRSPICGF
jgi:hypothetical protein